MYMSISYSETKSYCQFEEIPVTKKVKVNDFPSYFFKVHPSGKYIAYMGFEGNKLLDLENAEFYPLPGRIDPVFTPDGSHLLIPLSEMDLKESPWFETNKFDKIEINSNGEKMTFYRVEDFIKAMKEKDQSEKRIKELHLSPELKDAEDGGNYQSVSSVRNGKFSVLTDKNTLTIKDYTLDEKDIRPSGKSRNPCHENRDLSGDLPMLSKDGKFVSILNYNTETTQIYQINPSGKCNLALDLGIATGKVSFNWDSSQITFHVDHFLKGYGSYFSGVASDIIKNVYVLNLESSTKDGKAALIPTTWAKVSNNQKTGNGSYYPDFSKSGDIFFLNDVDNYFEFAQVKQSDLNFVPFYNISNIGPNDENSGLNHCVQRERPFNTQLLLGLLWIDICENIDSPTVKDSVLFSMSLNSENCRELVKNEWNSFVIEKIKQNFKDEIDMSFVNNVQIDDLVAACPDKLKSSTLTNIIGIWQKRDHSNFKQIVKQKCMMCHAHKITYNKDVEIRVYYDENNHEVRVDTEKKQFDMPPIDPGNVDSEMALRMLMSTAESNPSKRMPKGGQLNKEEMKEFIIYYQEKELEMPSGETIRRSFFSGNRSMLCSMYSDKALQDRLEEYINMNTRDLKNNPDREKIIVAKKKDIWCQYGQQGCKELIENKKKEKKNELMGENEKLNDEQSREFELYELELGCRYCFEVTYGECRKVLDN